MDGNAMTTALKVVNGINVDDLFSLIESVRLARISHTGWDLRGDRGSYTLTLWR
jgi:hypothetical protein